MRRPKSRFAPSATPQSSRRASLIDMVGNTHSQRGRGLRSSTASALVSPPPTHCYFRSLCTR